MKKPDFKRAAQDKTTIGKKCSRRPSLVSVYQQRWFFLDITGKKLHYYRDNDIHTPESGSIDMTTILDVRYSQVFDAPEFSLDLVSDEKHYTVVADTQTAMVRWAYAFKLCCSDSLVATITPPSIQLSPSLQKSQLGGRASMVAAVAGTTGEEFSVTFVEPGPLLLNVMGSAKKDASGNIIKTYILVTSFPVTADGSAGRAEATGKIRFRDFVLGINDYTFEDTITFKEVTRLIHAATWPKTFHFYRSSENNTTASTVLESWSTVFYPALNRRRRRYVELRWDALNFRKPSPSGSAQPKRDTYFAISQIEVIRPFINMTYPQNQRYTLQLVCRGDSVVHHVGADDRSVACSAVEVLELCFSKEHSMNAWRSALLSPPLHPSVRADGSTITVAPLETIEAVDTLLSSAAGVPLGIKSNLTGNFSRRDITLIAGRLEWANLMQTGRVKTTHIRKRSMFIADSSSCLVTEIRACLVLSAEKAYRYQLILRSSEQRVTIGMADEETLMQWTNAIAETVALAPPEISDKVRIPAVVETVTGLETASQATIADGDDDDGHLRRMTIAGKGRIIVGLFLNFLRVLSLLVSNHYQIFLNHEFHILKLYKS